MCRLIRVLFVSVPLLFALLVAPSAFAQSWISAVTATTTTTTATITWTTAVPANSQIAYGTTTSYGSGSALNSNLVTTHSAALTALTAGTTYHYRVLSADSTGALVTGLDNVFTTAAAISVSVSPTTATVASGGTEQFSAQITNTSNTAVTWSATSGTVSTTGLFTAPTVTATKTVTVTATSVADNTKSASATVTVNTAAGILTLNPTSISFGSVTVGQTSAVLTTTLTNTGNASLTITSDSLSAGDFNWGGKGTCNYNTLAPGSSCTYSAKFTPTATGTRTATIMIYSTASDSTLTLPLSGIGTTATAGTLTLNPTSLSFGSVTVGQTSPVLTATLTNTGTASLTITSDSLSAGDFHWGGQGTCNNSTLAPGASCTYSAKFTPTAAGTRTATIMIYSTASDSTVALPLSGIGTTVTAGTLGVSPATLALGNVVVSTSGTASGTLTAGGSSVTVSAVSSNNSAFTVAGLSLPVTIPAGNSAAFTVKFSPQTTGAVTAALTFTSNAQSSTTVETLTGTGTAVPVHLVNLSWSASTSSNVSGYNIYRAAYASACGPFSRINSMLNTGTLYTDSAVVDGAAYCYATTAVNTSNEESGDSNVVANVQVPAP
ncbi:MAG TPA: choice-of-anchor D domain-containing protein [Candidatus Sulfotelmatobacter sp.]|nr:choice-of-anchor D domain-containing protein [Candidatus Sulfotelmatobacter sp.]